MCEGKECVLGEWGKRTSLLAFHSMISLFPVTEKFFVGEPVVYVLGSTGVILTLS